MKYGYYEYYDLPDSYKSQANCSICNNLDLTRSKTDYNGKKMCYCKENNSYQKPNGNICSKVLIAKDNYNRLGSYTPSGCFITTIVCEGLGLPDDCEVLTTLRDFRENYLKEHPEYLHLLLQYDCVGPIIADYIRNEKMNFLFCDGLYNYFLTPCVEAIKQGLYEEAITIYQNMVIYLNDEFELPQIDIDNNMEYDIKTLGKGRIRKQSKK